MPGKLRPLAIFMVQNTGDHDFGYPCMLPETITMENFVIDDAQLPHNDIRYVIFRDYDPDYRPGKPYPLTTPARLTAQIRSTGGRQVTLCDDLEKFPNWRNYQ